MMASLKLFAAINRKRPASDPAIPFHVARKKRFSDGFTSKASLALTRQALDLTVLVQRKSIEQTSLTFFTSEYRLH